MDKKNEVDVSNYVCDFCEHRYIDLSLISDEKYESLISELTIDIDKMIGVKLKEAGLNNG